MERIAFVAGASGMVGKQLLFKLLENKNYYKVIALSRTVLHVEHPKLRQYETDFTTFPPVSFSKEQTHIDAFCCLGTTSKKAKSKAVFEQVDYELVVHYAEWTQKLGAKSFHVVSAVGADVHSAFFYARVKGKMEKKILEMDFHSIYIYRPSLLLGQRYEFRFAERIQQFFAPVISPLCIGRFSKYHPIHAALLANAMIANALTAVPGKNILEYEQIMAAIQS